MLKNINMKSNHFGSETIDFEGVSTYILKIASKCNLNCSYCYMYNMGDDTHLQQPKFINLSTVEIFAEKLNYHLTKYAINQAYIALHGGEPLLLGVDKIITVKNRIREKVDNKIDIIFSIQTNGVLLDEKSISQFVQNDIYIGISMDGLKDTHDKYRIDFKGRGSFDKIVSKFNWIKSYQGDISIITVINLDINPIDYYQFLLDNDVTNINVILLEANYDKLPKGYSKIDDRQDALYGKWLAKLFDVWINNIEIKRIEINIFEIILGLLTGKNTGDQMFGRGLNRVMTIESNGAIETVDMLRITENGFTRNNLSVFNSQLEDIMQEENFRHYYFGHHNLCKTCNICDFKDICGGGLNIHRYSSENGFDNPSIYCYDLQYIITHINDYLINLTQIK